MAHSAPRTRSLEALDRRHPRPAGRRTRDPEAECGLDTILLCPSKRARAPAAQRGRELIAHEVTGNRRDIEALCLCCGSLQVHTRHPLFEGGMCAPCKDRFLEAMFLYDEDGYQSRCSICAAGTMLLICESPACTRCYCFECVDALVGPGASDRVHATHGWVCFLCLPFPRSGLLRRRRMWRSHLKAFHDLEAESPLEMFRTVPVWKREPLLVLSLFGDVRPELTSLGFLEAGAEAGQLRQLQDVTEVQREHVVEWGPFDLVYGSTPAPGHARDRSPGWFLFQFYRLLQYARPPPSSPRPFFWMFVDNLLLTSEDQNTATRFFEVEPVTLQDVRGRVLRGAVRVWSNIPAVKRHAALAPEEEAALVARIAQSPALSTRPSDTLVKNCFFPLREYFLCFCPNSLPPYK